MFVNNGIVVPGDLNHSWIMILGTCYKRAEYYTRGTFFAGQRAGAAAVGNAAEHPTRTYT